MANAVPARWVADVVALLEAFAEGILAEKVSLDGFFLLLVRPFAGAAGAEKLGEHVENQELTT